VNFGTPVPLLLGIFLVLSAVALFFLDRLKPGYGRDSDKIYAILFLISGVFLLGSLTMELIPSFQQMIMVGMLTALMIQNINSRVPSGRPMPQGDGRDGYGGGYRPSRPSRPVYSPDARPNMRAELDRRDFGPDDPYARPRPMLGGRNDEPGMQNRPSYDQDPYSNRYGDTPPVLDSRSDNRVDHIDSRVERGDGPPYYGGAPRPDERVRRRRSKTRSDYNARSDYNDSYRVDQGNPPRPDYRPERDTPSDGWS
jgi:hypothetical protein